jgi:hypothetical protein
VSDVELVGERIERFIRCPEGCSRDNGGGEQMDVDPSNSAAMELASAHERDHLVMRNGPRSKHPRICREHCRSTAAITNEELTINELVAKYLVVAEQPIQLRVVRLFAGEETDPN